jgi:NADPH-dependent glutamate synthase beta subunit-like oxidoreductase
MPEIKDKKKEKVAIIGAGPAGLSAAWDLAIEGYPVTVFEALPVAGGMLAVGIPEYRLPKAILQKEVDEVARLGVEIKLNTRVADAEALLAEGYQAVFIASGAHKGDKMGIPGEDLPGIYDAIDFLRDIILGKPLPVGNKVAVIGGGNSAIDAARVAIRKGAKEVSILYRRELKDMPATVEEIEAAEAEGITVHTLTTPVEVIGTDGKVAGLKCVRMELGEFDRSGRRTPSPIPGSEYDLAVDMVIKAVGQRADTSFIKNGHIQLSKGGTITVDSRTLATSSAGIFAGGDAATGPATAIEAIAAGQRAASSIRRYLQGEELSPRIERNGYKPIPVSQIMPTDEETSEKPRIRAKERPVASRKKSFTEVTIPYTARQAREEASRCLRCDISVE